MEVVIRQHEQQCGVTAADIIACFQRRFRPAQADGIADPETRALLADLLDQVGHEV